MGIMNEYFKPTSSTRSPSTLRRSRATSPAGIRRSSVQHDLEPLTFARVHYASHAAAALFRWCVDMVETAAAAADSFDGVQVQGDSPLAAPPLNVLPLNLVAPEVLKRAPSSPTHVLSARPRAKAKGAVVRVENATILDQDRYFQCIIEFPPGVDSVRPPQIAELRRVVQAIQKRPLLKLQMAEYCSNPSFNPSGEQRLYSAGLFLSAESIPFERMPAEQNDPREDVEGLLCTLRIDADQELLDFFRDPGPGAGDPAGPCGQTLKRQWNGKELRTCNSCGGEISLSTCFYACSCHADSMICSGCWAKLAAGKRDPRTREIARWLSANFKML